MLNFPLVSHWQCWAHWQWPVTASPAQQSCICSRSTIDNAGRAFEPFTTQKPYRLGNHCELELEPTEVVAQHSLCWLRNSLNIPKPSKADLRASFKTKTGRNPTVLGHFKHLEGWDVLYSSFECYIAIFISYIANQAMLYNHGYIACVIQVVI